MLTKSDLSQIKDVVIEVVHHEVEPIKKDIKAIQQDIGSMQQDIGSMQQDIGSMQQDIKILKKNDAKIRKDLKTAIDYFDRDSVKVQRKVEVIEKHLGLQTN